MITLTAKITKDDGSKIVLNYRNSLSIERSIFDRSDITMPSWGVISNSGKLSFVDTDGSIRQLAEQRLLKSGMAVTLSLGNTLKNFIAPVGNFLTEDWSYDNDSKKVGVSISDELQKWQNILFIPKNYNPSDQQNLSGRDIYKFLYAETPTEFDVLPFDALDEETKTYLSTCFVEFFLLDSKNLWSAWNTFCVAFQSRIYKNNNGLTVCKHIRGG